MFFFQSSLSRLPKVKFSRFILTRCSKFLLFIYYSISDFLVSPSYVIR